MNNHQFSRSARQLSRRSLLAISARAGAIGALSLALCDSSSLVANAQPTGGSSENPANSSSSDAEIAISDSQIRVTTNVDIPAESAELIVSCQQLDTRGLIVEASSMTPVIRDGNSEIPAFDVNQGRYIYKIPGGFSAHQTRNFGFALQGQRVLTSVIVSVIQQRDLNSYDEIQSAELLVGGIASNR